MRASESEPAEMVYKDFDNNGSIDPLISYYIRGKTYPYVSRDELLDQLYPMRRKFTDYKSYADATLPDIFSAEEMKEAKHMKANFLRTVIFENRDGQFYPKELPVQAQFSPIYKILVRDIDNDNLPDLLLLGNTEYPRLKMGKIDADFGILLMNEGKANFRYVNQRQSGLRIVGDVKDALWLSIDRVTYLAAAANGLPLQWYKLNKP
jgi:hypothetical protein